MARTGRPITYDEQHRSEIVKAARTDPQHLELKFAHWTLDLLAEQAHLTLEIAIARIQLGTKTSVRDKEMPIRERKGILSG